MLIFFALTIFQSALLLFLVQPMVGKMVLPALGGTPAVWNTCMVFFQAILLAGYAYVHVSIKWLGVRRQAAFQMLVVLLPLLALPIIIDLSSVPTAADNPILWLLGRLLIGVGLPFFVVSTSSPLLQKWFSITGHHSAKDPYFLYAASNLGSLIALLGYPLLMEPYLNVTSQTHVWAGGYLLLLALTFGCAIVMWKSSTKKSTSTPAVPKNSTTQESTTGISSKQLTLGRRLRWIALALVPSSLMLGVTTHITSEIAPVPMLWVLPLAIYLLTFILVFARRPILTHSWVKNIFPFVIAPTALLCVQGESALGIFPLPFHLITFFITAMACHGELAKDRPPTKHLTEFYLLMSVGGVLGGLFNAAAAPLVFDTLVEYPLMMIAACVLLVHKQNKANDFIVRLLDFLMPIAATATVFGFFYILSKYNVWSKMSQSEFVIMATVIPAILCLINKKRALRFGITLGLVVLTTSLWYSMGGDEILYKGRNFYGTKKVTSKQNGQYHEFFHGKTNHGCQETHPRGRKIPKTYFHPTGPVGDIFRLVNARSKRPDVGIVGLGIGSMCSSIYAHSSQEFTFYEIDPEVSRIASDAGLFTFLKDCPAKCNIVLGDGRLTLANAPDGHYGVLFLDAFSSDAVPTHLLTREALQLYTSKLDNRGILVFNISNRYLDFAPLLANLADDAGLKCLYRIDPANKPGEREAGKFSSKYLVMARNFQDIQVLKRHDWKDVPRKNSLGVWTDKYTNVFSLIIWD